jgi:transposase
VIQGRDDFRSKSERDVLEARCRSPVTIQRDLKRARIVLLAAAGRSTRSIAKEVGVQPRIVSHWRRRFADDGLEGLQDKPRPGKEPIYTKETDKRILALLDKPPPKGFARWTGPLLAGELCDVDVQYVWRFLRNQKIDHRASARFYWYLGKGPARSLYQRHTIARGQRRIDPFVGRIGCRCRTHGSSAGPSDFLCI